MNTKTKTEQELPLRIIVRRPPAAVRFAMQRGPAATAQLVPPVHSVIGALTFELTVRMGAPRGNVPLRFLGPYVHGTPNARFLYVNSGQPAGDATSFWSRRAKVWLKGITVEQVVAVLADRAAVLEAEVEGAANDGGPMCASTHVLGGGWRLARVGRGAGPLNSEEV